jgi:hypothetical protein
MRDYFVHIIKELQRNDSISQTFVELNGPHHSNWADLPKLVSQSTIDKQHIQLITQITLL